jgi:hypothetical protein
VCQVKHDLMMLWVPPVRRRWKARKVKQRDISKVARGLFPEKGDRIEWICGPSGLFEDSPLIVQYIRQAQQKVQKNQAGRFIARSGSWL